MTVSQKILDIKSIFMSCMYDIKMSYIHDIHDIYFYEMYFYAKYFDYKILDIKKLFAKCREWAEYIYLKLFFVFSCETAPQNKSRALKIHNILTSKWICTEMSKYIPSGLIHMLKVNQILGPETSQNTICRDLFLIDSFWSAQTLTTLLYYSSVTQKCF